MQLWGQASFLVNLAGSSLSGRDDILLVIFYLWLRGEGLKILFGLKQDGVSGTFPGKVHDTHPKTATNFIKLSLNEVVIVQLNNDSLGHKAKHI
jgi:hypothetical protein